MTSPHKINPAAVIFDMDGLMLETETLYYRAWKDSAAKLGFQIDDTLFRRMIGVRTEECDQILLGHLGTSFPMDEFRVHREQCWQELADEQGIALKPGLIELLDLIDARGIPKAVATSSSGPEARYSLTASGLHSRFSVIISGDQVVKSKPAPDIFLAAAAALGVDPTDCIAVEDSSAGAIAASSAGMRTYIVPDLLQPSAEARHRAAHVFSSLHHALPLFADSSGAE